MKERVISIEEYNDFRQYLEQITGIVLGDNKQYLISSRLNKLMDEYQFGSYSDLIQNIKNQDSSLRENVINAMTTNETMWFRDIYPFEVLKTELLPELRVIQGRPLRIWSAACSSGQEPFTISMTISEFQNSHPGTFSSGVQIIATDISSAMLKYSQQGIYDNSAINRGLSQERRARFFKPLDENNWLIDSTVKARVSFRSLNLQDSYTSLGKFDLIFCRNVLIYFSSESKADILNRMADILNPNGYLFLGSSETPTRYTDKYKMIKTPKGVVYQKK